MSKINYKIYPINNIETALEVLGDLIKNVIIDLDMHKKYHNELIKLIVEYFDKANKTTLKEKNITVPTEEYDNIKDKIICRQMMLLRSLADEQKASFSYINLRRFLKNKGYLSDNLPSEISEQLNELLKVRNWTFHNVQSNYTARKKVLNKDLPPYCSVRNIFNPVVINKYLFVDIKELISHDIHLDKRENVYISILQQMKTDYEKMYKSSLEYNSGYEIVFTPNGVNTIKKDEEIQYIINPIYCAQDFKSITSKTAQLSMAIQNSKYDGSDEKFNEILSFFLEK